VAAFTWVRVLRPPLETAAAIKSAHALQLEPEQVASYRFRVVLLTLVTLGKSLLDPEPPSVDVVALSILQLGVETLDLVAKLY
jgi:hypothetical protein